MGGVVLVSVLLSVIAMTTQSPYSQSPYHTDYLSHHGESPRSPYTHLSDRASERLVYREPLVHRPQSDHPRSQPDHRPLYVDHRDDSHHSHDHRDDSHRPHDHRDDAMRSKRQAFLPYFPYQTYLPPFYQVHNIYLTPPGYNCYPAGSPPPPPPRFPERPSNVPRPPADDSDMELENRLGESDDRNRTTTARQEPSKCVWSIVACCSPGSRNIRYACFELLGCPGAFWDLNPCDERVVAAAANSALKFYTNNQAPTTEPTFQNL